MHGISNIFWSIDHCDGNPKKLRDLIDSAIDHFQNKHDACHKDSKYVEKGPDFIPHLDVVDDRVAVNLLTNFEHNSTVYRQAEDYAFPRDTFHVESFNNVCLIHIPKRIHFRDNKHNELRQGLAVLDFRLCVSFIKVTTPRRISSHFSPRVEF